VKRLQPIQVNDEDIIRALASNQRLHRTSYPHLQHQLNDVLIAYRNYIQNRGNPWTIAMPNISEALKNALCSHYASPPESVDYLSRLRQSSPEVCPMCGGFHPTTLDHYLPKTDYAAWAIFSKNLVPACGCNMARGDVVKPLDRPAVRVLHPYFDDFLRDRILTTEITHSQNFKWIKAKVVCAAPAHPEVESINFHINNVVNKNCFDNWQRGQLTKLIEFPANVIQRLPRRRVVSMHELIESLQDCVDNYDELRGTPNNWDSMLMHGLLNTTSTHQWLLRRHNDAVNDRNP
jgi:hypothetical protein